MNKKIDGSYFTFTAENEDIYAIMKNTKLKNNARRVFNDEIMTCEIKGKYNAEEYENLVNRAKPVESVEKKSIEKTNRVAVVAGSVQVGDIVLGKTVTDLGKWFQPSNDDFYSVNGIAPDADYVQYAYFN